MEANEIRFKKQLTDQHFSQLKIECLLMQILAQLTRHPNQVVDRHQFIEQVWQNNTNVGNPALTKAISKLRKLFKEEMQLEGIIETIPKKGYRLRAKVRPAALASAQIDGAQKGKMLSNQILVIAAFLALGLIFLMRIFSHSLWHQMGH